MSNKYLRQKSKFALEVFPEAIVLIDENHIIQFINPAAVRLFQILDVDTFLGESFSSFPGGSGLMTFSQRIDYYNHINELATNKVPEPRSSDMQQWSTNVNNHFFNFRAAPMRDENDQSCGFIICVDEWSGERNASQLLHSLFSELLTPLHSILGHSELLLKENMTNSLTVEQREWITTIKECTRKLLALRESVIDESSKQVKSE